MLGEDEEDGGILGSGGFSIVRKAIRKSDGQIVAVKVELYMFCMFIYFCLCIFLINIVVIS
jgi:hypothetical protein